MPRLVATVSAVAVLIFAALTLAHPSTSRILTWPSTAFAVTAWLLLALALAFGCATIRSWRMPPPLVAFGASALAIVALLGARASPFSAATLPLVWPTIGGTAVLFILHHTWSDRPELSMAWLLPLAGAVLVCAAYAIWALDTGQLLAWHTRNASPFGHSTYTAGAIVLVLPWLVFAAWQARAARRAAWLVLALLSLVVLASTQSRGGVAALGAAVGSALLYALLFAPWTSRRKLSLVATALVALAAAVATNSRLRDLVLHQRWSDSAIESNIQRSAMLQAAVLLGRERPLLGWGPGSIPLIYPRVRAQLDGGVENVLQVHNTPLQLWATGGALALLATTLLLTGVAAAAWRARHDPAALTASFSLLGVAVFSLTDHAFDLPFFALFAAANVAAITRTMPAPAPSASLVRWVLILLPFAALAMTFSATRRDLRARLQFDRALTALEANRGNDFRDLLERATAVAPHDPFFAHHSASYLIEARAATDDPRQQAHLAQTAAAYLERSLRTNVHLEFAHFNLGWLYLELANPTAAARHFTAAAHLVPDKGGVYFGLGLAYLAQKRPDAAHRAFALEAINDLRSATSPAWEVPALASHVPAIQAETRRLLAQLRAVSPAAAVSESWTRWLQGDPTLKPSDLPVHNAESAAFVSALPFIASRQALPRPTPPFPSTRVYAIWLADRTAAEPDLRAVMPAASLDYPAFVARIRQYPDDFRAFLLAPTGDNPALVSAYRRQRTGYGVLARHPEGAPLTDVFVVQENRAVTRFASGLFPRKGSIPGRFLLALLPEASR